jgi:hypothetical protein
MTVMDIYWFVIGALCVWRVTHLFQAEDGPWDLFVAIRKLAGRGFFGKLLDCFHCLSIWVAIPVALLIAKGWKERLLVWLALSGAAILLERATNHPSVSPAIYSEDGEDPNVVLRK